MFWVGFLAKMSRKIMISDFLFRGSLILESVFENIFLPRLGPSKGFHLT